jgi:hypothetical protein
MPDNVPLDPETKKLNLERLTLAETFVDRFVEIVEGPLLSDLQRLKLPTPSPVLVGLFLIQAKNVKRWVQQAKKGLEAL